MKSHCVRETVASGFQNLQLLREGLALKFSVHLQVEKEQIAKLTDKVVSQLTRPDAGLRGDVLDCKFVTVHSEFELFMLRKSIKYVLHQSLLFRVVLGESNLTERNCALVSPETTASQLLDKPGDFNGSGIRIWRIE